MKSRFSERNNLIENKWSLPVVTFISSSSKDQEPAWIRHCNQMLSEMLKLKH